MIIFPAVDIMGGECVRLKKGDFDTVEKVYESPLKAAEFFEKCGAKWLHTVDLDGAKNGRSENFDIISEVIRKTGLKVEVGGGIRNMSIAERYISAGVSRIVLGSAALSDPDFVKEATCEFGDKIAVGIDAKNGFVSVEGWCDTSDVQYIEFAERMEYIGVKYIIFTDISRDGMLSGPNIGALRELQSSVNINIIASGGIRDIENIKTLTSMGLYGTICGKSLYCGTLDLREAISVGGKINAC